MLELASQRGFPRENSAPRMRTRQPQEFRRCWLLRFSGKKCRIVGEVGTLSGSRIGPRFFGVQGNGACEGGVGPGPGHSRCHGRPVVLRGTHNSLMENRLSPVILLGQEPFPECGSTGCCIPAPGAGMVDTTRRAGHTDTNGAIAGALLGGLEGVRRPRSETC